MKRWMVWLVVSIAVALLLWLGSRPAPLEVQVTQAEQGLVESTVSNTRAGTVKACQRSRLSLQIGGQVDVLNVKEGDEVTQGQLLMSLWNKDRVARVAQATAALASAKSEKQGICITAKSDGRESKRLSRLVEKKLTSAERADLAASKAAASASSCSAATARVEQAAAELELSESLLEQTLLYAPFDGIVAEVTGEIGEYSTPSPPGVATPPAIDLLTDHCHYISAPVDEVDASEISVGMPVRVTLDAYRGRVFPGTVRRIAPYILELEKQARTVEVEVELEPIDAQENLLLAGYSADVEIIRETREKVLRIPTEVVVEGAYLYIVDSDNHLEKRQVKKGIANWRYTEVLSGLSAAEQIVVNVGMKGLEPGVAVKVTEQ